jgi:hypothetical protein
VTFDSHAAEGQLLLGFLDRGIDRLGVGIETLEVIVNLLLRRWGKTIR